MSEKVTDQMKALVRRCAHSDQAIAAEARREFAQALTNPLRQGVLYGDVSGSIFEVEELEPGVQPEYSLDFITSSNVNEFIAYTVPNAGKIPQKNVEADYLTVPTYFVAAAIDWNMKFSRDARFPVIKRALDALKASFVRKKNNDCFHTLIAAAVGRNLIPYDSAAVTGLFTKRLLTLMEVTMTRNAGGNTASQGRGQLTDVYLSPESKGDMKSWDLTQVDDVTRREIFLSDGPEGLSKIGGVLLHALIELGTGQEWDNYYRSSAIGGTFPSDKNEIVLGLDLKNRDSFYMPVREMPVVYDDPTFLREFRQGCFSRAEWGTACINSTRALAGAL